MCDGEKTISLYIHLTFSLFSLLFSLSSQDILLLYNISMYRQIHSLLHLHFSFSLSSLLHSSLSTPPLSLLLSLFIPLFKSSPYFVREILAITFHLNFNFQTLFFVIIFIIFCAFSMSRMLLYLNCTNPYSLEVINIDISQEIEGIG